MPRTGTHVERDAQGAALRCEPTGGATSTARAALRFAPMATRPLEYKLTRTRNHIPLVTLVSPLGNDHDIEPAGVRALAQALLKIAAEAERVDTTSKDFRAVDGCIELEWPTTA